MKFNLDWLKKFVNINISADNLSVQITNAGLEVESFENNVYDLSVPPNRPDCLGMVGLAREVSAILDTKFNEPVIKNIDSKINDTINLHVDASNACPKYLGRIIKNVDNARATPQWIQDALVAADIKLISPVVDITNYILLEWGQPLHAFDLAKLQGDVFVRYAKKGENLTLLDDSHVELTPETLIIADAKKPLAIAGVKGGKDSGIEQDTKDILLECAYFEPVGVRLTSRHFGLKTDGAYRFERGIDPTMQEKVIEHLTKLIIDVVGGEPGPIVSFVDSTHLPKPVTITLRHARIAKILGINLNIEQVKQVLERLSMQVNVQGSELIVKVPAFRTDISKEIDLIEEIVRIYGYDNVPAQATTGSLEFRPLPEAKLSEAQILTCLANRGYHEAITYSFIDAEQAKLLAFDINPELCLTNPISAEMGFMRPSLLPGLIKAVEYNQNRQQARIKLFEIGLRYQGIGSDLQQIKTVAGISCGYQLPESWANNKNLVDLYDVKGDVIALFDLAHNATNLSFQTINDPMLHPGQSMAIYLNQQLIGKIGALHPSIQQTLSLTSSVFLFEIDYAALSSGQVTNFKAFGKFPAVRRDIAILVAENILSDKLEQAIKRQVGNLLTDLVLFDVYQGKGVPTGQKSMGYGLTLQHLDRTFTDAEVNEIFTNLISMLQREFNATLR